MNFKQVGFIIFVTAALTCVGLSAQEEVAPTKPKRTPSKEDREAKAKVRQQRHKAKAKADAELLAKAVDINHATKVELLRLPGITEEFAASIIAKRPFRSKADLVTRNAIPRGTYQNLHSLVVAK